MNRANWDTLWIGVDTAMYTIVGCAVGANFGEVWGAIGGTLGFGLGIAKVYLARYLER